MVDITQISQDHSLCRERTHEGSVAAFRKVLEILEANFKFCDNLRAHGDCQRNPRGLVR